MCRSRNRSKTSQDQQQGESSLHSLHNATPDSVSSSPDEATVPPEYTLNSIPDHKSQPIEVTVFVNGTDLQMEVDTGAALSLISESTWSAKFPTCSLQPTDVKLRTYSGDPLEVKGTLNVTVQYKSELAELPLLVVKGQGPSLLGRNWLSAIRLEQYIHAPYTTTNN